MSISAQVIAHSISPEGKELLTFQYTAHRFILAEINTHGALSKSARSSRAVPVKKLIEEVRTNPAMPIYWGSNQPGMQAGAELTGVHLARVQYDWKRHAREATEIAQLMLDEGLHKQVANRVLEPFMWVHGVITGTEWDNFFALRMHKDAQPEFRVLAEAMWDAKQASVPRLLSSGQWHLPYITMEDQHAATPILQRGRITRDMPSEEEISRLLALVSAARCARVSYKQFDGSTSIAADLELAAKLKGSEPGHWSPFAHQGTPDNRWFNNENNRYRNEHEHRNFVGFRQHRAMIGG